MATTLSWSHQNVVGCLSLCSGAVWLPPVPHVLGCRIPTVAGTSLLPSASLSGKLISYYRALTTKHLSWVRDIF